MWIDRVIDRVIDREIDRVIDSINCHPRDAAACPPRVSERMRANHSPRALAKQAVPQGT
jgi:hypothetical protein